MSLYAMCRHEPFEVVSPNEDSPANTNDRDFRVCNPTFPRSNRFMALCRQLCLIKVIAQTSLAPNGADRLVVLNVGPTE